MSWRDYKLLIYDRNTNPKDWRVAGRANPCTPAGALKVAVMSIFDNQDDVMLERFCEMVIAMAESRRENEEN